MAIFNSYVSHYQGVNPIKIPWNHHFPMVFLWFSYGFPMVSYGFPMVFQRVKLWSTKTREMPRPSSAARSVASPPLSRPWWRHRKSPGDLAPWHLGLYKYRYLWYIYIYIWCIYIYDMIYIYIFIYIYIIWCIYLKKYIYIYIWYK